MTTTPGLVALPLLTHVLISITILYIYWFCCLWL